MKIQLPLENWTDLLPFVPRRQLVEIVKQLGDRQFAKILLFFLSEFGQITLAYLRIAAPWPWVNDTDTPIVEVRKEMPPLFRFDWYEPPPSDLETNLPKGPMPTNVRDFKLIELSYFDMSVANFLHQFQFQQEQQQQGNSLLDNVNLWFSSPISPHDDNTLMPILAQLMPMIDNINSMSIDHLHHKEFGCVGLGPDSAASQLLTTMLTKARILDIRDYMQTCMFSWSDWLIVPRKDGKPRALRLSEPFPDTKDLIERIKMDFSATRPVSFFVYVRPERGNVNWQDTCLHNGRSNERLVVKTIDSPPNDRYRYPEKLVLISRYPIGANKEWIKANEQEIVGWKFHEQNRRIRFEQSLGWPNANGDNV